MSPIDKYVERFIWQNRLRPADVIVVKKIAFGMVDHFVVYLGRDITTKKPVFAANYTSGTQYIWQNDLQVFLQGFQAQRIERFNGSRQQRDAAVQRALSKIGENQYNYLANNCEHYKNFVQLGVPYSKQAEDFVKGAATIAGIFVIGTLLNEIFSVD